MFKNGYFLIKSKRNYRSGFTIFRQIFTFPLALLVSIFEEK